MADPNTRAMSELRKRIIELANELASIDDPKRALPVLRGLSLTCQRLEARIESPLVVQLALHCLRRLPDLNKKERDFLLNVIKLRTRNPEAFLSVKQDEWFRALAERAAQAGDKDAEPSFRSASG